MSIIYKTIFIICMVLAMGYAFLLGMEREAHRQEVASRDICLKYELECRG